jgi:hypothetical protein
MSEPRTILTSLHICDEIDGVLHFIPCSVTENVAGYTPMGKPRNGMMGEWTIADPAPWYWGKTNDECQAVCDEYNRDSFGIEPEEAMKIVASSMRAQNLLKSIFDY